MITSKSAQKRFAWDSVSMVKNSQWKNNKTIRKKEKKKHMSESQQKWQAVNQTSDSKVFRYWNFRIYNIKNY